jgi:hypothetical protein
MSQKETSSGPQQDERNDEYGNRKAMECYSSEGKAMESDDSFIRRRPY